MKCCNIILKILSLLLLLLLLCISTTILCQDAPISEPFSKKWDASFEFPDDPIQLVKPDHEHKKLVIIKENVDILHKIEGPVATVAVVGKFHSGKSFLMNQLMGKRKGFGVGPSVSPETMGIWMWGRPMPMLLSNGAKVSVIFLDTEGFAANNVSENYDAKIFAVATLISSHLLYNSVKIIDQGDIDYLELLARRTQLFALRSQMSKAKWTNSFIHDLLTFPPLIWVVQDFVQSTIDGETPQKWLHRLMESHTRENEDYEISLMSIFTSVDCHTLFLPATKKKFLMDLSLAGESDLTEEYKDERDNLISKLKKNIVLKEKNNRPMTGRELAGLFEILVNAANDGSLSDVPSRWNIFVDRLKQTATEDCLKFFENEMAALDAKHQGGPIKVTELREFSELAFNHSKQLLSHLLQGLDEAKEEANKRLVSQIEMIYERTKDLNEKKIKLKSSELQSQLELKCEEKLRSLTLPIPSSKLTEIVIETRQLAEESYSKEMEGLIDEKQKTKYLTSLKNSINNLGGDVALQNSKAIEGVLKEAVDKATAAFLKATRNADGKPRKPTYLDKLIENSGSDAKKQFERSMAADYSGESLYKPFLGMLQTEIATLVTKLHEENEELVRKHASSIVKSMLITYRENTGPLKFPLPMNESDLLSRLDKEAQRIVRDCKDNLEEFDKYPIYQTSIRSLMEGIQKIIDTRKEENVEAYKREVEKPLDTAKKIILISADKYRTVFSLKQFMIQLSLLQLNDGNPKDWPIDLKISIIQSFIAKDKDLQKALSEKDGIWSSIVGFFEWLMWFLGLV